MTPSPPFTVRAGELRHTEEEVAGIETFFAEAAA